jgi:hypothetical protein
VAAVRKYVVLLLTLGLILSGCARRSGPDSAGTPGSVVEPPVGSAPAQPDQNGADRPSSGPNSSDAFPPVPADLQAAEDAFRQVLNAGQGTPGQRLAALFQHWQVKPLEGGLLWAEGDLDGDGDAEWVTVWRVRGEPYGLTGRGTIFVLDGAGNRWQVYRGSEEVSGPRLHGVRDLTGDGRAEIVWSSTHVGAHTANSLVYVWDWAGGQWQPLTDPFGMASMQLTIAGKDVILRGGLIGSVGAGGLQRERTERYRWVDGAFRLVDRQFQPSQFGYHRLQDGIVAEEVGRVADALQAYREAMEPRRLAAPDDALDPDQAARFPDAVRALARGRLVALLLAEGRQEEAARVIAESDGRFAGLTRSLSAARNREEACRLMTAYAEGEPEFLTALNSPVGYANPRWQPATLCGPLPFGW